MKKILIYLAAAAMSVAACSTKENAFVPDNLYTVTARMGEASEVRVAISDTGSPSWQEGDAIALYNGTAFVRFTLTDAASGTFSGPVGTYTGLAVYPADFTWTMDGDNLSVELPATYTYAPGQTFSPMIAKAAAGEDFSFFPVAGVYKFTFTNIPADVSEFTFTTSEKINGTFNLGTPDPGTTVLPIEGAASDGQKSITVAIPQALHQSEMSFYFPAPVTSSTRNYNGLSISLAGADGVPSAEVVSFKQFNLGRKQMLRFKSTDCNNALPGKIYLIGDCLDPSWDWSENNTLVKGEGAVYTGSIYLTQNGGFKMYLSNDWSATWLSIDETNSTSDNLIVVGGEAYKAAHSVGDTQVRLNNYGYEPGRYTMTVNLSTKRMTLVPDASGPEKLYMVGGSFSPSWQFSESLALAKGSDGLYTASGIQMAFGDNNDVGFRIYTVKDDWGLCYTYGNGGYDANGIQLYYHDAGGDPPQIFPGYYGYEDGTYDVSFNINTMVLTLTPSVTPGPAVLYLVGSPFTWSWSFDGTPLTRQSSGLYTASAIEMDFGPGDYGFRIYTEYNVWNNLYTYKDGGYDSTGIQLAYHDAGGDPPQIFPGYCGFASGTYDLTFDISSLWLTLTKK